MADPRRRLAAPVILAALSLVPLSTACRESSPPSVSKSGLSAEYLGRWSFGGGSGGLDWEEVDSADGSWIRITARNTIEQDSAGGALGSTESFEPTRGRSIFSGSDAWILEGPDAIDRVIQVHPDRVLGISENVYDGFGATYTKQE
jgi:hypothetical protein